MSCVLEDTSLEVLFLVVMLKADETFLANQIKPKLWSRRFHSWANTWHREIASHSYLVKNSTSCFPVTADIICVAVCKQNLLEIVMSEPW